MRLRVWVWGLGFSPACFIFGTQVAGKVGDGSGVNRARNLLAFEGFLGHRAPRLIYALQPLGCESIPAKESPSKGLGGLWGVEGLGGWD